MGEWFDHSHQVVHMWYTNLAESFDPKPDKGRVMVIDETKAAVENDEVSVWAVIIRWGSG